MWIRIDDQFNRGRFTGSSMPYETSKVRKQAIISSYLWDFRAQVAKLHAYSQGLSQDLLDLAFSRLAREYGWVASHGSSTNDQILDYLKTCGRLAVITNQLPAGEKPPKKIKGAPLAREGSLS